MSRKRAIGDATNRLRDVRLINGRFDELFSFSRCMINVIRGTMYY